jgi:glycosyltransferase involved in cell wall biosynthesis
MKVAIVHDFLVQMGGAEKVVETLHDMFPDAPIYTSIYDPDAMPIYYRTWDIRTSFLQKLWMKKHSHRLALLLYPTAFESFDLSDYDIVISSSSAFAKGVITQPNTAHICYTYTPMRYAWTTKAYMNRERLAKPLRLLLSPGIHYLRTWDAMAADRVDKYVGISTTVAKRIAKFYRRDCEIVFPPVETKGLDISPEVDDYYIIVSRFVPYKRIDLAVEAFTRMGIPLKVVGTGRQMKELQAKAGPNVQFLGRVDDVELPGLLARAKGYVMPGEEDFGLAPVEANACGRPVVAFAAGGALDTQIDGVTGVLFNNQTVEGLCHAVQRAESIEWDPYVIQAHARKFETAVFRERMMEIVTSVYNSKNPKRDRRRVERRVRDVAVENDRRVASERRVNARRMGDRLRSFAGAGFTRPDQFSKPGTPEPEAPKRRVIDWESEGGELEPVELGNSRREEELFERELHEQEVHEHAGR